MTKPTLDEKGWEHGDPEPMEIPAGFKRPETLQEQIKRLIKAASNEAAAMGLETFEEAEDFNVDDDFDPSTPYEVFFDPVLNREVTPQEFDTHKEHYMKQYKAAYAEYFNRVDADNIMAENLFRWKKQSRAASERASSEGNKEGVDNSEATSK